MQQYDAYLFQTQSESGGVSCQKIYQKQTSDDVPPREPGNSQVHVRWREEKKEASKIAIFRFVNADINLVDRSEKNQDHGASQAEDGQFRGSKRLEQLND